MRSPPRCSCAGGCRWRSSSPLAGSLRATRPRLADLVEELSQSPARLWRHGHGEPGGDVGLRLVLPSPGARPPAVLPATGDQPVRARQPAGRGRAGRRHPGRGGEGARRPARSSPADPRAGRPVPLPRPHPRLRGRRAPRGRTPSRPAAGGRPAPRLLPATPPTRPTRFFIRSGTGCAVSVARPPCRGPALVTPDDAAAWLDAEWRNILQAAQYAGRHEWKRKCADLIHALAGFVEIRAYWDEAIAAHTLALQACRDLADPARIAQAALELSVVSQQTGRHEATLPLAEDAAAIYRSLARPARRGRGARPDRPGPPAGDPVPRGPGLLPRGQDHVPRGRGPARRGQHAEPCRDRLLASRALPGRDGSPARGALALPDVGDRRGEAKTLNNLGKMQLYCGYHRDALECYQKSLEIFTEIGGAQNQAILYHNIGSVYRLQGQLRGRAGRLPAGAGHLPRHRRSAR